MRRPDVAERERRGGTLPREVALQHANLLVEQTARLPVTDDAVARGPGQLSPVLHEQVGEHLGFGGVQLRRLDRAVALDEFDGRQAQPCGERLDVPRSTPDQQVTYDDRDDEQHVGDRRHERHDHDRRHRVNASRGSPAPGIAAPAN